MPVVVCRKTASALKGFSGAGAKLEKQRGFLCSLVGGAQDGTGVNWGRTGLGRALVGCWVPSSIMLGARSVLFWRR